MMKQYGKVAVLFGGRSAEREVSLKSGAAVLAALQAQGVDAIGFDPAERPLQALVSEKIDRVFIALHGRYGEDGTVQGALDLLGIPYTGSGVLTSSLAMDKWRTKLLWQAGGIPTPPSCLLNEKTDFDAVVAQLGLPIVVKPAREGSSIGMTKVVEASQLKAAWELAAQHDDLVLAEQFIEGEEYTVALLGEQALPAIQIIPAKGMYDYQTKYFAQDTQYLCPCSLSKEDENHLQSLALKAFSLLGGRGWGRIDIMREKKTGNAFLLEANTAPGMTSQSLVPRAARQFGLSFEALVLAVLDRADVG